MKNIGVPQAEVAQVLRHERPGTTLGTYNPRGLILGALKEVVERVGYEGRGA